MRLRSGLPYGMMGAVTADKDGVLGINPYLNLPNLEGLFYLKLPQFLPQNLHILLNFGINDLGIVLGSP